MPFITVNQGGPDIDPGVYPVALTAIDGPKTIYPQSGVNAGKAVDIFDWTFTVIEGSGAYSGTEIQATTSTASGPRSKMFTFLTALLGGKPPAVGQSFEVADLVGKMALATISRSDSGWPRIDNLGAFPTAMRPPALVTAPQVVPAAVVAAPVATVVADPDGLPF